MRWGGLASWQCGHSLRPTGFSASWVRRLAVRVFECRRFGLGIANFYLYLLPSALLLTSNFSLLTFQLAAQGTERGESRIVPGAMAVARFAIQVLAAGRAQALAVLAAERLHRQRQVELFAHQLPEVDLVVVVERRRQIVLFDLTLRFAGVLRVRLVAKVERLVDRHRERLEAPAARQFQGALDVADDAELLLVLEDIEGQGHGLDDREVLLARQLIGLVDALEPLLRRADLVEVQGQHEPLNIPCSRAQGLGLRLVDRPRLGD